MIHWLLFIVISALSVVATFVFVPAEHRRNYAQCRKDRTFWLANFFSHSIWIVAVIQSLVAPDATCLRWLQSLGAILMMAGHALVIWAWAVNLLFVPAIIYVPPELRVTDGPYSRMDHPGYSGLALAAVGGFFLLGQLWAFPPTLAYLWLLSRRMVIEDRILSGQQSS